MVIARSVEDIERIVPDSARRDPRIIRQPHPAGICFNGRNLYWQAAVLGAVSPVAAAIDRRITSRNTVDRHTYLRFGDLEIFAPVTAHGEWNTRVVLIRLHLIDAPVKRGDRPVRDRVLRITADHGGRSRLVAGPETSNRPGNLVAACHRQGHHRRCQNL